MVTSRLVVQSLSSHQTLPVLLPPATAAGALAAPSLTGGQHRVEGATMSETPVSEAGLERPWAVTCAQSWSCRNDGSALGTSCQH